MYIYIHMCVCVSYLFSYLFMNIQFVKPALGGGGADGADRGRGRLVGRGASSRASGRFRVS